MHATTRFSHSVCQSSDSHTKSINGFLFSEEASPLRTASIKFYFSVNIANSGIINVRILQIKILLEQSSYSDTSGCCVATVTQQPDVWY